MIHFYWRLLWEICTFNLLWRLLIAVINYSLGVVILPFCRCWLVWYTVDNLWLWNTIISNLFKVRLSLVNYFFFLTVIVKFILGQFISILWFSLSFDFIEFILNELLLIEYIDSLLLDCFKQVIYDFLLCHKLVF